MSHLDFISSAADELSQEVASLIAEGHFRPVWKGGFGWRHPDEMKDAVLFWLTKLAGIASTVHASVSLAKQGYWFQVGVLARSVTEGHLSMAYTLPKVNTQTGDWPNTKQQEAIQEHFKETWTNPLKPFLEQRQRKHIRELAAALGHVQKSDSVLTQHDASQVAVQSMRVLSDYTHMAYPQVMELFSLEHGFRLAGGQQKQTLFGEYQLGRLIVNSFIYVEVVCAFLRKGYAGCLAMAESEQGGNKDVAKFRNKLQIMDSLYDRLEAACMKLEHVFPSSDKDARKVLRAFKVGEPW